MACPYCPLGLNWVMWADHAENGGSALPFRCQPQQRDMAQIQALAACGVSYETLKVNDPRNLLRLDNSVDDQLPLVIL